MFQASDAEHHAGDHRELAVKTVSDLFFPTVSGVKYQPGFFTRMFREMVGDLPEEITPHVLRHSFASVANDLGFTDATVAALLGHRGGTMTSRYQHVSDAVLLKAADSVADETARLMGESQATGEVIPLRG
jgi:integrase